MNDLFLLFRATKPCLNLDGLKPRTVSFYLPQYIRLFVVPIGGKV